MVLVFITTIVFGALMPSVVAYFKRKENNNTDKFSSVNSDLYDSNNKQTHRLETFEITRYDKITDSRDNNHIIPQRS